MPVAGRKITVQIGDDPDDVVEWSLAESITTFEGSGPSFQRRILKLNNGEDFSRTIAVRDIWHRPRLDDDDPEDKDQKIKCAVIIEMTTNEGSGPGYRKRIYGLNPNKESNKRNTHIKRIYGKNADGTPNMDVWLDVMRKDQFQTEENSGKMFWRRFQKLIWNDDADDNDFDKNDLVAELAPTDPTTKIYPSDFVQDIVNVNASSPLLIIAVTNVATGNLPGLLTSSSSLTELNLRTPLVPAVPPPPPPPDKPGKPQIPANTQSFEAFVFPFGRTYPNGVAAPPAIANPFTKDMKQQLLFWDTGGYGTADDNSKSSVTIFINLKKFKQGGQKKATFNIDLPEVSDIGDISRLHQFRADYHAEGFVIIHPDFSEVFFDDDPSADFKSLALQQARCQELAEAFRDTLASQPGVDSVVLLSLTDIGKVHPSDQDYIQGTRNTKIQTYTFGGGKTFPLKDGLPDLPKTDWKSKNAAGELVERWIDDDLQTIDAPGPLGQKSVKIIVDFETIEMTVTIE